jgi:hypothetical protein
LYDPANFHLLIDSAGTLDAAGQLIFSYVVEFSCPGLVKPLPHTLLSTVTTLSGKPYQSEDRETAVRWHVDNPSSFITIAANQYEFTLLPGIYHLHASASVTSSIVSATGGEFKTIQTFALYQDGKERPGGSKFVDEQDLTSLETYYWTNQHSIDMYLLVLHTTTHFRTGADTISNSASPSFTGYEDPEMFASMHITLVS